MLDRREEYRNEGDDLKVGLEIEYAAVDEDLNPIATELRDEIIDEPEFMDVEVGGSQFELNPEPFELESISELEEEMSEAEQDLKSRASERDVQLIRSGTNPFVTAEEAPISNEQKYQEVPESHRERRGEHVRESFGRKETVDPRNVDMAALINSTQINVEAESLEDAVEKANYTHMISPFLTAISGNARFLERKDTGFSDLRTPLWEISHDVRDDPSEEGLKLGRIDSYHEDIEDYFGKISDKNFILTDEKHQEEPIDVAAGTYWKDAKIKLERDEKSAVVEARAVSTQPTVAEDAAMHGFFLGRLAYAQENNEELMGIEKVNRNRYTAMLAGMDSKMYGSDGELAPAEEVVEEELDKAREGLDYLGLESEGLEILYDRIERGVPADRMAEGYEKARERGKSREEALLEGLELKGGLV